MIISSFNVSGLLGNIKNRKVKELVRDFYLDFIAIKKVKLSQVGSHYVIFYMGVLSMTGFFCPYKGVSGKLFSIWCNVKYKAIFAFYSSGYLGVYLQWVMCNHQCFVVSVYAKFSLEGKREI